MKHKLLKHKLLTVTVILKILDSLIRWLGITDHFIYVYVAAVVVMGVYSIVNRKKLYGIITDSSVNLQWIYVFMFLSWGLTLILGLLYSIT